MKNWVLILSQMILVVFLASSVVSAAPNIDGVMEYSDINDWGSFERRIYSGGFDPNKSLKNVSVEEQYANGNTHYDVEELGLYVSDNKLYIGIQTQYNLAHNPYASSTDIDPGDFIFKFDNNGPYSSFSDVNTADNHFALDFTISGSNVDMTLLAGDMVGTGVGGINNYGTDWGITSAKYSKTFTDVGVFNDTDTGYDGNSYPNGVYTLEAAIDMDQLSGDLAALFTGFASTNEYVTTFWQPSCGNDFLAARSKFDYTPPGGGNPIPEPGTFLLFGLGLLGAGSLGRKRINLS